MYVYAYCYYNYSYTLHYSYKLPASIVKLWESTWCALCTKKELLNALLEKWQQFETLCTSLLTFLIKANSCCNALFEQLGVMTSLMDIDCEMKNFKVSSHTLACTDNCLILFVKSYSPTLNQGSVLFVLTKVI